MKELKDYLPLYLGCYAVMPDNTRVIIEGAFWNDANLYAKYVIQDSNSGLNGVDGAYRADCLKIILRPLSDLSAEDFYSFNQHETEKDILLTATINKRWCAGWYDKKEYAERIEEGLCTDAIDMLYDLEQADYTNVLCCDKDGAIAYGLDDEYRYFTDLPTQANWINHLRKRGFDCDRLIENGLAIDKNTLNT
jgi:hypothetical protein